MAPSALQFCDTGHIYLVSLDRRIHRNVGRTLEMDGPGSDFIDEALHLKQDQNRPAQGSAHAVDRFVSVVTRRR